MKTRVDKVSIKKDISILDTLRVIDETALEIALVVDENRKLLGTATDGDIRRGIINGISLEAPIMQLMNKAPITANQSIPDDELLFIMTSQSIKHLPLTDSQGIVTKLVLIKDLIQRKPRANAAVIMAGGLGSRLGSLTKSTPKPMLPVGNKPIIANIVEQLSRHGITEIYISVNYKSEVIKNYFKQSNYSDCNIMFLEEREKKGTAGSLSLLPKSIKDSFIVINGDVISPVNFGNLIDYHNSEGKSMTVCTREFGFEIPYGVVSVEGTKLTDIVEKPSHSILINAGIYVLEPQTLNLVPTENKFDMPELIKEVSSKLRGVSCYPISEYWIDIGNPTDYGKAKGEFVNGVKLKND